MKAMQHKFSFVLVFLMISFLCLPAHAFLGGKFKQEVEKEKGAGMTL